MDVYERLSAIHAKREGMGSVELGNATAPFCTQHPALHNIEVYKGIANTATDICLQILVKVTDSDADWGGLNNPSYWVFFADKMIFNSLHRLQPCL